MNDIEKSIKETIADFNPIEYIQWFLKDKEQALKLFAMKDLSDNETNQKKILQACEILADVKDYYDNVSANNSKDDNFNGDIAHKGDCNYCNYYLIDSRYCVHCQYNK